MKKKKEIEENLKIDLAEHLNYEIRRMREIFLYIIKNGVRSSNSNQIITENFILVAFLTHIRNLYSFFYNYGNKDWASAEDFIQGWLELHQASEEKEIKEFNGRINHFLSHLSYRRVDSEWKPWEIDKIYYHFRKIIIEFLSKLQTHYLVENLKTLLKDLKEESVS